MKLITVLVRPERLSLVKQALFRAGVHGLTISRVSGHGGEASHTEQYRGSERLIEFHEKIQLMIAVTEDRVDPVIDVILGSARTGEIGDGKIFVQPLERVVRIRTGENDLNALEPIGV